MVKIIKESPNNQIFLPQKSIIMIQILMIQSGDKTCRGSFSISPREISSTKRQTIWEDLCALLESIQGPWVFVGDFNVIINEEEKEGGRRGSTSAPNFLKEILFDLGAVDLSFAGNKFTWFNKRLGKNAIK
jgi:hypothetical protein